MKELIKVTEKNGKRAVNARDLYNFLEVKSKFADWIKNRIYEYGFIEFQDFVTFSKNLESGGKVKEYALSIDMAKELSMVEKTERGRQARRYFIEMERVAKEKLTEAVTFQRTNVNSLSEKRVELINAIRCYIRWGDMNKTAKELGLSYSYVKRVVIDKVHNTEQADLVVNALYQKALQNKNELLFSYQQMIDLLKN